jgi:tetratricopeptide (TPR) repeat protein
MQTEEELIKFGVGSLDTNKFIKAIEYFTQAIELNSKNSETFELRGIAWFKIFNIEQALHDTIKAIELDIINHRAWFNKGEILKYKKEFIEAEFCYIQADKLYPDSNFYLTGLIQTSKALKKYQQSIEFCNRILNERPSDAISLYYRGMSYAGLLNYPYAIKDFLKLIEIGKKTATNYNNLGYWYSKIGELKKARNNLSVALQLNPTHPYALNNMGFVMYLEGNFQKALELITRAIEIDASNSYSYKNRALVYLKINKRELALHDLNISKSLGYKEDYDSEVEDLLMKEFKSE